MTGSITHPVMRLSFIRKLSVTKVRDPICVGIECVNLLSLIKKPSTILVSPPSSVGNDPVSLFACMSKLVLSLE